MPPDSGVQNRVVDISRGDLQRASIGRLELLQWVNQLLQLDYPQASLKNNAPGTVSAGFCALPIRKGK